MNRTRRSVLTLTALAATTAGLLAFPSTALATLRAPDPIEPSPASPQVLAPAPGSAIWPWILLAVAVATCIVALTATRQIRRSRLRHSPAASSPGTGES
jgi:hypothetical protein